MLFLTVVFRLLSKVVSIHGVHTITKNSLPLAKFIIQHIMWLLYGHLETFKNFPYVNIKLVKTLFQDYTQYLVWFLR